ncbi:DUF4179 domain-containing protein [Cytobacillus sp. FJAT-54145]|uniref:DUF4179 domain-containing protein n=1 Tax=Cytobacillus spartinae TaxID=3299023 RepID=A0ABW6KGU4_9BACI
MNEKEEKFLNERKNQLDQIEIPSRIDDYILSGLRKGKKNRTSKTGYWKKASLLVACLLLFLVGSIRFSPTVAAQMGKVPIFEGLVKLITMDKGLKLALENDFIRPIGVFDEHDGIKFTIDALMADESRILLFYTMENDGSVKEDVFINGIEFTDENDHPLRNYGVSYGSSNFESTWVSEEGVIDISMQEGASFPETIYAKVKLARAAGEESTSDQRHSAEVISTWNMKVPIDKNLFTGLKEVHELNETVEIGGQKFTFKEMVIHPTRIGLEVEYDPDNTKKIFQFDDIMLVDEKGESFGTINNGVSASHIDENRVILYFQSNYFSKPENIYIKGTSVRALEKKSLHVEVDLEQGKLLNLPDERLTFKGVRKSTEGLVLDFNLKITDPSDKDRHFDLFSSTYKDASQKEYFSNSSGSSSDGDTQYQQYYIEDRPYESPLILTINDYPSRITGSFNIKVK